ncbi:sel1 repeat family protein [Phreatobacter stygius]|uniref:Sel1 repeat family protein n=1 Tax=Phreatobacter stygius TaxID=1940610 RepID=A0A4D7BBH4_9HYPH|nr:sel1 repeat family protein [Phreatobacter stygius]QCI68105.1 sel1 repeat family protein [Phreatobacter stygius]
MIRKSLSCLVFGIGGAVLLAESSPSALGVAAIAGSLMTGAAGNFLHEIADKTDRRLLTAIFRRRPEINENNHILLALRQAHLLALDRVLTRYDSAWRDDRDASRSAKAERFSREARRFLKEAKLEAKTGAGALTDLERTVFAELPAAFNAAFAAGGKKSPEAALVDAQELRKDAEAAVLAELLMETGTDDGELPPLFRSIFIGVQGDGWFDIFVHGGVASLRENKAFHAIWTAERLAGISQQTDKLLTTVEQASIDAERRHQEAERRGERIEGKIDVILANTGGEASVIGGAASRASSVGRSSDPLMAYEPSPTATRAARSPSRRVAAEPGQVDRVGRSPAVMLLGLLVIGALTGVGLSWQHIVPLLASAPAIAANPCDFLAKAPWDKDSPYSGPARHDLPLQEVASDALSACRDAHAKYPNEARFQYQLGRALRARANSGRSPDAKRDLEEMHSFVSAAFNKNYPAARLDYAYNLIRGLGVGKNPEQGWRVLLQQLRPDADPSSWDAWSASEACAHLFEGFATPPGVPEGQRNALAFRYCDASFKKDRNPWAASYLSVMYFRGQGVTANPEQAFTYAALAEPTRIPGALHDLGWFYQEGAGGAGQSMSTGQRLKRATELFLEATKVHERQTGRYYTKSDNQLCFIYFGVLREGAAFEDEISPISSQDIINICRRAEEAGCPSGFYAFARMYSTGSYSAVGIPKDGNVATAYQGRFERAKAQRPNSCL